MAKNIANIAKHGLPMTVALGLNPVGMIGLGRMDESHGEPRGVAFGMVGGRLQVLVFTKRGHRLRVISLRKANARERRRYAEATQA